MPARRIRAGQLPHTLVRFVAPNGCCPGTKADPLGGRPWNVSTDSSACAQRQSSQTQRLRCLLLPWNAGDVACSISLSICGGFTSGCGPIYAANGRAVDHNDLAGFRIPSIGPRRRGERGAGNSKMCHSHAIDVVAKHPSQRGLAAGMKRRISDRARCLPYDWCMSDHDVPVGLRWGSGSTDGRKERGVPEVGWPRSLARRDP
jgi:hypothetical protein